MPIIRLSSQRKRQVQSSFLDYTIPLIIFAGFGVMALLIAIYLKVLDKKRNLGLELPNIEK